MKVFASPLWPMSWFYGMSKIDLSATIHDDEEILYDGDIDLALDPASLCDLIGAFTYIATSPESYATKVVSTLAKMLGIEDQMYPKRLSYEETLQLREKLTEGSLDRAQNLAVALWLIDKMGMNQDEHALLIQHTT